MAVTLYYHPFSRAAGAVFMLEEVGVPYELRFVDLAKNEQKSASIVALNPMGKLPVLTDDDQVVTETAAIGLYLADRYAAGRLAPTLDDPARATYLRWSLFAPSVIEPGVIAKGSGGQFRPSQAGWGTFDEMLDAITAAIDGREWLLGDRFTMADVIFGGTLRYLMRVGSLEKRPLFTSYTDRLSQRPASQRADARNAAVIQERGLGR
jgi:glutathione S-transferase